MTQPRSGRTVRIVLLVVGFVLVLCCGGVTVAIVAFNRIQGATGPARDSAETFIQHLGADETDAAYGQLCERARGDFTEATFAQTVHNRPKISSYTVVSTNVSTVNGRVSAGVAARLTYADGSSENHVFPLVKEGDAWRVCGQPY